VAYVILGIVFFPAGIWLNGVDHDLEGKRSVPTHLFSSEHFCRGVVKDNAMNPSTFKLARFSLLRTPRSIMEEERVSLKERLNGMERAAILEALKATGWIKAKAARELGMTERMIGYKIKKYGIGKEGGTREEIQGLEETRGETSAHYHKGGKEPQ
jgi:hypothetical protein